MKRSYLGNKILAAICIILGLTVMFNIFFIQKIYAPARTIMMCILAGINIGCITTEDEDFVPTPSSMMKAQVIVLAIALVVMCIGGF